MGRLGHGIQEMTSVMRMGQTYDGQVSFSCLDVLFRCVYQFIAAYQFRVYRWGEIEILEARDTPSNDYLCFSDVEIYDAKINGETKVVKVYKDRETFLHARSILRLVR